MGVFPWLPIVSPAFVAGKQLASKAVADNRHDFHSLHVCVGTQLQPPLPDRILVRTTHFIRNYNLPPEGHKEKVRRRTASTSSAIPGSWASGPSAMAIRWSVGLRPWLSPSFMRVVSPVG